MYRTELIIVWGVLLLQVTWLVLIYWQLEHIRQRLLRWDLDPLPIPTAGPAAARPCETCGTATSFALYSLAADGQFKRIQMCPGCYAESIQMDQGHH